MWAAFHVFVHIYLHASGKSVIFTPLHYSKWKPATLRFTMRRCPHVLWCNNLSTEIVVNPIPQTSYGLQSRRHGAVAANSHIGHRVP